MQTTDNAPRLPRRRASRRAFLPRETWPRIGAVMEDGAMVIRPLEDDERPVLARAVVQAEPCNRYRTVAEAAQQAAEALAARLRQQAGDRLAITVRV